MLSPVNSKILYIFDTLPYESMTSSVRDPSRYTRRFTSAYVVWHSRVLPISCIIIPITPCDIVPFPLAHWYEICRINT